MDREMLSNISDELFVLSDRKSTRAEAIHRPSLTYWQDARIRLLKDRPALVALSLICLLAMFAVIGPHLVPFDYRVVDSAFTNLPYGVKGHWLGTDGLGRDLWARLWMGARTSLIIGIVAAIANSVIGTMVGGISGYFGGKLDLVLMRTVDVLYGIPYLIVAILMMVVLGTGMESLIVALIVVGWISTARLVRGQVLQLKGQEFILAARKMGTPDMRIIFRHMVPCVLGLIITNLTMTIPTYIFTEAFLSFIGLGVQPPECSWGIMCSEGAANFRSAPQQLFFPAVVLSLSMLSFNIFGDSLRDALDPKMR
jgi:oligopeptide transport system permease protein